MKKKFLVLVALIAILTVALIACDKTDKQVSTVGEITVSVDNTLSTTFEVNTEDVDFTKYFSVVGTDGYSVQVTADMLDLSKVDFSKEGTFTVVLTYEGKNCELTFRVVNSGSTVDPDPDPNPNPNPNPNPDPDPDPEPDPLAEAFAKYQNKSEQNYILVYTVKYPDETEYTETSGIMGNTLYYAYEEESVSYVDYHTFSEADNMYVYYADTGRGEYTLIDENNEYYASYAQYLPDYDIYGLKEYAFKKVGMHYEAEDAEVVATLLFGEIDGFTYTGVEVYLLNDYIGRIVATLVDEDEQVYEISLDMYGYGTVDIDVSSLPLFDENRENDEELQVVLAKYVEELFNFTVDMTFNFVGYLSYTDNYGYTETDCYYTYEDDEGQVHNDYLVYDAESGIYNYYADNLDGTYTVITQDDSSFEGYIPMLVDLTELGGCLFIAGEDGSYEAYFPEDASYCLLGYLGLTVKDFTLYTDGEYITKIVETVDYYDIDLVLTFTFGNYGGVTVDVSGLEVSKVLNGVAENPEELVSIFEGLQNPEEWNFIVTCTESDTEGAYSEEYGYLGADMYYFYEYEEVIYLDYLVYDSENGLYVYYSDNTDGTYTCYDQNAEEFEELVGYMYIFDFTVLGKYAFTAVEEGTYTANDPVAFASEFLFELNDSYAYDSVTLTVANGKLSTITIVINTAEGEEAMTLSVALSNYGEVEIDVSELEIKGEGEDPIEIPEELAAIFAKYEDMGTWNFKVNLENSYIVDGVEYKFTEEYGFAGYNQYNKYDAYDEDDNFIGVVTDYVIYDPTTYTCVYYSNNGDNTYETYDSTTDEYAYLMAYWMYPYLNVLQSYGFTAVGDHYEASAPAQAGKGILYEYEWTKVSVYVANGNISKMEFVAEEDEYVFVFSAYGEMEISVEIGGGNDDPVEGEETLHTMTFDAAKTGRTEFNSMQQVWVQDGITFTNDKASSTSAVADYSKPVRCYQGSNITVACDGMVKVVFYCNNTTYATALGGSTFSN